MPSADLNRINVYVPSRLVSFSYQIVGANDIYEKLDIPVDVNRHRVRGRSRNEKDH